ncbi:MAG TPA: SGNH/GDSL hydrolase family protein [Mycobacteriales bacterium]|nr:SGNH/GDSL hydrolase family protein [Mycobacteriales bacterium]
MGIAAGSTYVALGSSMAAGPGIKPIIDRGAMRSGLNYPHQVAEALKLKLIDATISGATTETVLHTAQRTLGGRRPPQIRSMVPDADLVTITIGGNDLGYIGGLTAGSVLTTIAGLPLLLPPLRALIRGRARFATPPSAHEVVAAAIAAVVEQVRAVAPDARIVLVDYLTVIGSHARRSRALPLTKDEQALVRGTADGLAAAFEAAAATTGADLVQASAASIDHGVGSPEPWVTGFEWGNPLAGGRIPYHPNLAGMTAVAEMVVDLLR